VFAEAGCLVGATGKDFLGGAGAGLAGAGVLAVGTGAGAAPLPFFFPAAAAGVAGADCAAAAAAFAPRPRRGGGGGGGGGGESSFHVRDGVAASLPVRRFASSFACRPRSRQACARSRRGIILRISAVSFSVNLAVRNSSTAGAGSGAYPRSTICWRVFIRAERLFVSTLAVVQCGLKTFSQPSFSSTRTTFRGSSSYASCSISYPTERWLMYSM